MSEHDKTLKDEARAKMLEACGMWIDQWEHTAGSVVTGWLVATETVRPDGTIDVQWASGNGSPDVEGNMGGLSPHRLYALARHVERDLDAYLTATLRDRYGEMHEGDDD